MLVIETPAITLTTIGSNKIGVPSVLIFLSRDTSNASESINGPVRDRYPKASSLLVVNIMDLHIAPRLLRRVVEAFIRDAYEDACQKLPKDWPPRDYLLLAPDWDGKLTKSFGFSDTNKIAGVAVLDRQGKIVGTYQGKNLTEQTLSMLDKISMEIV